MADDQSIAFAQRIDCGISTDFYVKNLSTICEWRREAWDSVGRCGRKDKAPALLIFGMGIAAVM
jgi:hypothetical protein